MERFTARSVLGWVFISLLMMGFIFGCATAAKTPPPTDIRGLVGKWEGYGYNNKMGVKFHIWMTIRQDGKWMMSTDQTYLTYGNRFDGGVWVDEGKYIFNCETPGLSGTGEIRSSMGSRWLMFRSHDGGTVYDVKLE